MIYENGASANQAPPAICGVRGEPGGTRAMGACEPGQGGNAAAISIAFMCPGAPPRLSPTPSPGCLAPAKGPSPSRSRGGPPHPSRPDGARLVAQPAEPSHYTVVARRYRPQRFEEV